MKYEEKSSRHSSAKLRASFGYSSLKYEEQSSRHRVSKSRVFIWTQVTEISGRVVSTKVSEIKWFVWIQISEIEGRFLWTQVSAFDEALLNTVIVILTQVSQIKHFLDIGHWNLRKVFLDTVQWNQGVRLETGHRNIIDKLATVVEGNWSVNLLSFLLRCSTRPHEWGTQWESNSLV